MSRQAHHAYTANPKLTDCPRFAPIGASSAAYTTASVSYVKAGRLGSAESPGQTQINYDDTTLHSGCLVSTLPMLAPHATHEQQQQQSGDECWPPCLCVECCSCKSWWLSITGSVEHLLAPGEIAVLCVCL